MKEVSGGRRIRIIALRTLFALLVGVLLFEGYLRLKASDHGGIAYVNGVPLLPYERVSAERRTALARDPNDPMALPYEVPDPELGWTIRPQGRTEEQQKGKTIVFAANSLGLRSLPSEVLTPKPAGTRRIVVFGDSLAHGDELAFEDTWTKRLEDRLGPPFEVWNAGVPGYGTDQAFLRARKLLPLLSADIAILTIYRQNLTRNLTFFRAFQNPTTGIPWSKPRFVISGDGLALRNAPCVPPDQVEDFLAGFESSALATDERFFDAAIYEPRFLDFLHTSRYFRSIVARKARDARLKDEIRAGREAPKLAAEICKAFVDHVAKMGARPLIVLLPDALDLPAYQTGGEPLLHPFIAELKARNLPYVDCAPTVVRALANGEDPEALYVGGKGHPNARCAKSLAEAVEVAVR